MIVIAIGANLADPRGRTPLATCQAAAQALGALAGLHLQAISRWYESAPMPPSGQPPYINGVAGLDGTPDPAWLLAALQTLEAQSGRVRGAINAARTLDLDIIDLNGLVRAAPDPILPHPRAHLRAFVLRPLADIAPDWRHPISGIGVADLLAALPDQEIRPLLRQQG